METKNHTEELPETTDTNTKPPLMMEWTYVWIGGDGALRSTLVVSSGVKPPVHRFDGSATKQASTDNADLFLVPVRVYNERLGLFDGFNRDYGHVLCEVQTADGTPHASNSRANLREFLEENIHLQSASVGFEQDVLLIDPDTRQPYRWPTSKNEKGDTQVIFPGPQGRYYGGTGDFVRGRKILENFSNRISYKGVNLREVRPGICLSQWSFVTREKDLLGACDDLIMCRYFLEMSAEDEDPIYGSSRCVVSYSPKSFPGTDWHGNGCAIRIYLSNYIDSGCNPALAKDICERIGENHREHIASYGAGNEQRLVGKSGGISDYNKFTWGHGDRTASICVPTVPVNGEPTEFGFLEDRRPGANMDPYTGVLALSRSLVDVVDMQSPIKAEAFEPKLVN